MNIQKIWEYSEYASLFGCMLTREQTSLIQSSLAMLQNDNHFSEMLYWGQIYGITNDYHLACGYEKDAIARKFFYSTDLNFWALLPHAKKKHKHLALLSSTPIIGDPTSKNKVLDEALEENNPDRCKGLKEEARLSAIVSMIGDEIEVCARGQYLKQPDGIIEMNKHFQGLTMPEAKLLKSYMHFRTPQQRWNTNLLTRPDYNYSIDFLDTLVTDIPSGCWSLQMESESRMIYLQNLYWPGSLYFHKVGTPDAGFLYLGNGRKNLDVPFLL